MYTHNAAVRRARRRDDAHGGRFAIAASYSANNSS